MKATNKALQNHVVESLFADVLVPEKCGQPPENFEKYIWETQDGRLVPIKEFNDHHLLNTYNMLKNTIIYAKRMMKHRMIAKPVEQVVRQCYYHVHYLGHEIHLRKQKMLIS